MNERQLLEMGIRALGVVFLLRAIADGLHYFVPLLTNSYPNSFTGVLLPASTVLSTAIAIAMTRYAPVIASNIQEASTTEGDSTSATRQSWNRWLVTAAGTFVIATAGIQAFINTARTFTLMRGADGELQGDLSSSTVSIALHMFLLIAVFYTVLRQPRWLFGKHIDVA